MAVNGVEIKVGQVWKNGFGAKIYIKNLDNHLTFCWKDSSGLSYTDEGIFYHACVTKWNLVSLFSKPAEHVDSIPGPAGDSTQATTFGPLAENDSGVGDINSDAKGSGARFNTGKVPYELVPIEWMALYWDLIFQRDPEDVDSDLDEEISTNDLLNSLYALGGFQSRRESSVLMDVLLPLGDGWEDCARVFDYGKKKYAAWNWSRGMAWSVPLACATRHLLAMINGEEIDPESGLPHRGHVYCNICMLLTYEETFAEGDDRPADGALADNETYL